MYLFWLWPYFNENICIKNENTRIRRRQQLSGSHLSLKALNQDGHEQIEEHVVAERHEGNEVERRPGRGGGHAVIQNHVPVLLRKDLEVGWNTDGDWGINKKRGEGTG